MKSLDLAWKVLDDWAQSQYDSKETMIRELGNLNDVSIRMAEIIEEEGLTESDGLIYISSIIEERMY